MFDCGCPDKISLDDIMNLNINLNCSKTWDILGKGLTKGVFQLESYLGKHWCKELKPEDVNHLAALGSILRPGALNAKDENNISITRHYCLRKNKQEDAVIWDESIKDILEDTYQLCIFQEQITKIAERVAGFNLLEQHRLLKAGAKKSTQEMSDVGKLFIEKARQLKVIDDNKVEEMWGWLEKSQRYLFNRSHSVSYGVTGYITAYLKAHYPLQFFNSWLTYSKDKQDPKLEVRELVHEAKQFEIPILPPSLLSLEEGFHIQDDKIRFGIVNIKGIGNSQLTKVKETIQAYYKPINECNWLEFLIYISDNISKTTVENLISVGAMPWLIHRKQMLSDYNMYCNLTDKEKAYIKANVDINKVKDFSNILELVAPTKKKGGGTSNKNREQFVNDLVKIYRNPPSPLIDDADWMVWNEEQLLGIALSCSKVEGKDISSANCTCAEFEKKPMSTKYKPHIICVGCSIDRYKEIKIKNGESIGKTMAFLTISDHTGTIENVTAFCNEWEKCQNLVIEGNTVLIVGSKDNRNQLVVKEMYQL